MAFMSHCQYVDDCKSLRNLFYKALNQYRLLKSVKARADMINARTLYNSQSGKCHLLYDQQQTQRLLNARLNNDKDYWKMLRGSNNTAEPNISNDQFYEFFTSINAPESDIFLAQDDADGNDEFENNFHRKELLVMFEELESPITENEVLKSVKHYSPISHLYRIY